MSWSLESYRGLCEAILASSYSLQTVQQYISAPRSGVIILRHDVDRFPKNALAMAQLEQTLGIASTYYVRCRKHLYDVDIARQLAILGHEVGYHYEALSMAGGDNGKARDIMHADLQKLRAVCTIATAAAHGSPLSKWSNQSIWRYATTTDFDLLGEAYESIDYDQIAYYTDTGRAWDATSTNLRDTVSGGEFPVVANMQQLKDLIATGQLPSICIQTHPERWSYSLATHGRSLLWDTTINTIKLLIRQLRSKGL